MGSRIICFGGIIRKKRNGGDLMKKNILIVDDSALMRRLLSDIIESDDRFRIAGVVRNGESALRELENKSEEYDVVLLDFFLPDMNADELLQKLSMRRLRAKVIIISGIIKEDAMEVIRALEDGAFDFVTKPESFSFTRSNGFAERLLACVELATSTSEQSSAFVVKQEKKVKKPISINSNHVKKKGSVRGEKLVALACSTGGPKALHQVIPKLPKNMDAPMVIVQHMPKGFTNSLAMRLNEMSQVEVKEAVNGDVLKKGCVYIAKGGMQMRVENDKGKKILRLTDEPARNGLRPCADIMYESLVGSDYQEIVCVVLTGMGGDGTAGIKQLNEKNNIYSITQTAETCTVYGMPKVFYESGLADEVVPLSKIADAIGKRVGVQ